MKLRMMLIFMNILLLSVAGGAQELTRGSNVFKPSDLVQKPAGLLNHLMDPSKFDMTQSYSLSYMSSGNRSSNIGLYLNTMTYRFSDPLLMQLRIGYMHQPFGTGSRPLLSQESGSVFIQGANIEYRPTDNMLISFEYSNTPSMMLSPYRWNRW